MANKPNDKQPSVFDDAAQHVATMESLKQAEGRAEAELGKRNVALSDARKKQSQRFSQLVIDGKELPAIETLPEESKVEQSRAALLGIRKRISDHDIPLLTLKEKFNAARVEHNAQVVKKFLADTFMQALRDYQSVVRQGHALAEALGERLDPKQVTTRGSLSVILQPVTGEGWSQDSDAKRLHDSTVGMRNIADKLSEYAYEAERRVRANEKLYHSRKLYDPSPRARYKVVRPFTDGVREFKVGDVLDQLTLGFELTRLEAGAGKLLRMLPEDEVA